MERLLKPDIDIRDGPWSGLVERRIPVIGGEVAALALRATELLMRLGIRGRWRSNSASSARAAWLSMGTRTAPPLPEGTSGPTGTEPGTPSAI